MFPDIKFASTTQLAASSDHKKKTEEIGCFVFSADLYKFLCHIFIGWNILQEIPGKIVITQIRCGNSE